MTVTRVSIDKLSESITIPHILKWLKSQSINLDGPQDISMRSMITRRRSKAHRVNKTCFVNLKSEDVANKFVKKFNEKKVHIGECKDMELHVSKTKISETESANMKRQKGFKWLKVTNLKPKTSAEELKNHIQKSSKVSPENVHVRHSGATLMAFVEMKSPKDAQTAMKKTQMSTLKGNQIWAEQVEGESRHLELKEKSKGNVVIRNLPAEFNKSQAKIKAMCEKHGKVVKAIKLCDREVYFGPALRVQMSTIKEAQKVFDELHGHEFKTRTMAFTLSTAWWSSSSGGRGLEYAKGIHNGGGKKKKTKKTGGKKKAATEDEMKDLMKLKNIKIDGKSGKDKLTKKGKKGKGKEPKKSGVKK